MQSGEHDEKAPVQVRMTDGLTGGERGDERPGEQGARCAGGGDGERDAHHRPGVETVTGELFVRTVR